jgi:hypothetical protein
MTDIFVSDLFGYNIDNDTPFVVVATSESYKLLKKIAKDENTSIWEYNRKKLDDILKSRNVDPSRFVSLGNVLYQSKKYPKNFLLCNKSICHPSTDFEVIAKYGDGQIVRPFTTINDKKIYSLGLYFSKDKKIDNSYIGTIDESYLLQTSPPSSGINFVQNEFSLLCASNTGINTINKNKLLKNDMTTMKISNSSDKYLTNTQGCGKKNAKTKSKQKTTSKKTNSAQIAAGYNQNA